VPAPLSSWRWAAENSGIYTALTVLSLYGPGLCCRPPVWKKSDSVLRERYRKHKFADLRTGRRRVAESYVRTGLELSEMSEHAFFDRFSGETARVCAGLPAPKPDDIARQVLELHQRHGQAIGNALKTAVEMHSVELIRGSVPPTSVLIMTIAPGRVPALASIGKRGEPLKTWIEEAEGAPGDGGGQQVRGKSKPALEHARGAVKELYPKGTPSQAAERRSPAIC
jgi:hypothetical protein